MESSDAGNELEKKPAREIAQAFLSLSSFYRIRLSNYAKHFEEIGAVVARVFVIWEVAGGLTRFGWAREVAACDCLFRTGYREASLLVEIRCQ